MKSGGKRFTHLAPVGVLIAIILAVGITVASSFYFYKVGGKYEQVYNLDDPYDPLQVYLRIDNINPQPQKFAVALASVRIYNGYDDDIHVEEIRAEVYNGFKHDSSTKKFGQDSARNIFIPAKTFKVVKMNVKIYNYTDFRVTSDVYVYHFIHWTHGIQEYVIGPEFDVIDISYFQSLFSLPP